MFSLFSSSHQQAFTSAQHGKGQKAVNYSLFPISDPNGHLYMHIDSRN